jgi:hypothetical protein
MSHRTIAAVGSIIATLCTAFLSLGVALTTGAQSEDLQPYSPGARASARQLLASGYAVYPGSRYGYALGHKVRLDNVLLGREAELVNSQLLVPPTFAYLMTLSKPTFSPPPPEFAAGPLAEKWVHEPASLPASLPSDLTSFHAAAAAAGLTVSVSPEGIHFASRQPLDFAALPVATRLTLVTLFDTPEKLADPAIATQYIPMLKAQGTWNDHIKATPQQLAELALPEIPATSVPPSSYSLSGFNAALLGSSVPAPGVYPRILFSPQDIPAIAARIRANKYGQMSLIEIDTLLSKAWWDPTTSDGQLFQKLATGQLDGLKFPDSGPNIHPGGIPHVFEGQKPGIYSSHVAYVPECLTVMALWCLIHDDDTRGRQVATAIANFYRLREPYVDEWNNYTDSQFGGTAQRPDGRPVAFNGNGGETHWRGMHGNVASMNIALALDFAGKWMTPDQLESMRRIIAKATYGRRAFGQDGPLRLRDVNWVTWDLPQFLALTAIEGLPGFDAEAWEQGRRTVKAFLDYGIDPTGYMWESNGKSGGGLQFQIISMIALARRGDNQFGHPHLRQMLTAQAQVTSPNGRITLSGGTFSGSALAHQFVNELKAFYPADRAADYLMDLAITPQPASLQSPNDPPPGVTPYRFDEATYRAATAKNKRLRLPSPTYPAFVRSVVYDTDWLPTTKADLNLPLDYISPTNGVLSSYSDRTPDAAWLGMLVRPNHYMGAGHHHSDSGMFVFSALGVNWFTEASFNMTYDGKYHNQVIVDGESQPGQFPARAHLLSTTATEHAASLASDLTYAYSWRWTTQPPQVWPQEMKDLPWELEPADDIRAIYRGTLHYKMRPWWPSYTYSNAIPTSRAPFNPMQYVYRTGALIRGEHPYAVLLDDLKKDNHPRSYQWTGILGPDVRPAALADLPPGALALVYRAGITTIDATPTAPTPAEPMLLIYPLAAAEDGTPIPSISSIDLL